MQYIKQYVMFATYLGNRVATTAHFGRVFSVSRKVDKTYKGKRKSRTKSLDQLSGISHITSEDVL